MPVTIMDIAQACGVSAGTVDRALNNRPGIKPETKRRILEVARQMNYRPDYLARSLARGRTMTLGVIMYDLNNRSLSQIINAIHNKAREYDYFIDFVMSDQDPHKEKDHIEYLVNRKVDGIILFPCNYGQDYDDYLATLNTPIVTIINRISDRWPYIGIDDTTAMKQAVELIRQRGYEHIIYICPNLSSRGRSNTYVWEKRLDGVLEGVRQFREEDRLTIVKEEQYIQALEEMDLTSLGKTAILCSCDFHALEIMIYLREKGISVPKDIGLMGFDNIDTLRYVTPSLTTIDYAVKEIGTRAVEALLAQIEGNPSSYVPLLDYKIIQGDSL